MKVRGGRYNLQLAQKAVLNHRFDGIQATYGKDVKLMVGAGKQNSKGYDHVVYGEASTKMCLVDLMVGYYDFQDHKAGKAETGYWIPAVDDEDATAGAYVPETEVKAATEDKKIFAIGASVPVAKNVKVNALYLDGDMKGAVEDKGFQASIAYKGAKASVPGSWGLEAFWYDLGDATYVDHTHNGLEGDFLKKGGFEGYSLQATYALAKNIVAKVEWYNLEAQKGKADSETLWAQVVFTF